MAVAALALVACADDTRRGRGAEPGPEERTVPPSPSDAWSIGTKSFPEPARTVTGVLTFDDGERGCIFLRANDGTRYEVVYPARWHIDRGAAELRGPAGVVVPAGAALTVTGSIATDRGSTCQGGPILVATSVRPAG